MILTIMIDTEDSFLHDYVSQYIEKLKEMGHDVTFITDPKEIAQGDCLFLLGCGSILSGNQLKLNKHNLVVHPSKLPEGRGSAALVWEILKGENTLYLTLFEANLELDRGEIYFQESIQLEGHELSDEIRSKQAIKTFEFVMEFVKRFPNVKSTKQEGKGSFYPKRKPKDSELDINKTIRDQFNLLRIVDNDRYPAFFFHRGRKYIVKISKDNLNE